MRVLNFTLTRVIAALIFVAIAATLTYADIISQSHSCYKPIKPYKFTSQYEIDNFNDEVRRFKSCIDRFVEQQNDAIRNHQSAANDAIEAWNRFVRFELR